MKSRPLFALGLLVATLAPAQQRPVPHLGYVYPAGGQQGQTLTIAVGGQNLVNPAAAHFSVAGIHARVLGHERPMTQAEINNAREMVQQLQERRAAAQKDPSGPDAAKSPWTPADETLLAALRLKLMNRPGRQATPAIAETVTLELTIAADVPPGEHELRLRTATGLSNPFTFCVGLLPEISEPVVTATSPLLNAPRPGAAAGPRTARTKPAREIAPPAIVNGQILPGEADRFRFHGRQGQRLTLAASARSLNPYLADAVPGWFQPTLALFGPDGREIAYADDNRFHPDPVICFELPADGEYTVEIKDAIYRGREDFVYRLAVGELPFVTSLFPLAAAPGEGTTFRLAGWNLPAETLVVDTRHHGAGTYRLSVRQQGQLSNAVKFAVDLDPVAEEAEPNHANASAQRLSLPQVLAGRIGQPGDEDLFRFEGEAGAEIVAEVFARRLGSPLDAVLELSDAAGRRLAANDDYDDRAAGLLAHQADARIQFTLPTAGAYFLRLRDTQSQGGADYAYRLRVGAPRPDFELRVVPASINLRAAGNAILTVHALRRDGFAGAIELGLIDAPRGFALSGARVPAGQDQVTLTLSAPPAPLEAPVSLALAGRATIGGQTLVRRAVPAVDRMQAFANRHLVPAKDLLACVTGRSTSLRVSSRLPVRLPADGTAKVELTGAAVRGLHKVRVDLFEPPAGVTVAQSTCSGDRIEVVLAGDPAKVKPGWAGNLVLNVSAERPGAAGPAKKAAAALVATAPAIPLEVLPAGAPLPAGPF